MITKNKTIVMEFTAEEIYYIRIALETEWIRQRKAWSGECAACNRIDEISERIKEEIRMLGEAEWNEAQATAVEENEGM